MGSRVKDRVSLLMGNDVADVVMQSTAPIVESSAWLWDERGREVTASWELGETAAGIVG